MPAATCIAMSSRSNVLIRSSSTRRNIPGLAADETVVLGDFGLARGLDLSALTMVAGSPGYVAPEQAAGLTQLDRRADLYPLGRMMLEMLTGDPGGRATTMAGAATEEVDVAALLDGRRRLVRAHPSRVLVEPDHERLVAKNPDERPSSAEEVAAALVGIAGTSAAAAAGGPGRSPPLTPPSAPPLGAAVVRRRRAAAHRHPAAAPRRSRRVVPLRRQGSLVAAAALLAVAAIVAVVVALAGDSGGGGERHDVGGAGARAGAVSSGRRVRRRRRARRRRRRATAPAPDSGVVVPIVRPISTAPATEPSSTDTAREVWCCRGARSRRTSWARGRRTRTDRRASS